MMVPGSISTICFASRCFYDGKDAQGVLSTRTLLAAMGWGKQEKRPGVNYTRLLGNAVHFANCFIAVSLACVDANSCDASSSSSSSASELDSPPHVRVAGDKFAKYCKAVAAGA